MNAILKYCIVLNVCLFCNAAAAQGPVNTCDTIPYEVIGEKIVLSLKLNGKPAKFILDTGGVNLITSDVAQDYGVQVLSRETMSDVNGRGINFFRGGMTRLELSENLTLASVNVMICQPQPFFRLLGVVGALGGEAFADICLTFDAPNKRLILTHPYRPAGVPRNGGLPMQTGTKFHSIFPMRIGGVEVPVLFDTGFDGFFHITKADHRKIAASEPIETIASGNGIWHVGISGFSGLNPEETLRLRIPSLTVMDKEFTDVATMTQNTEISIIGPELMDYGTVILDYPRGRFYFYPFDENPQSMEGRGKVWNVCILPVVDHFEVTGVVGVAAVEAGERVWDINGTSLDDLPLSQLEINELLKNIEGDTAYILVGKTKNETRRVLIEKI